MRFLKLETPSIFMDPLLLVAAFFAEVIGTVAGFGSSTIFLPIALLFMDFPTALVVVAIFHISGNIGRIIFFKHGIDKNLLLTFGIPSIILTLAGALLVASSPQLILRLVLGIFLVVYASLMLLKPTLSFKPTKTNAAAGGMISGFFAGLIGTGGALRGAFLNSFKLKKERYIATAAAIALAVDMTRLPVYISNGFLPSELYLYLPILFVIAIAGSYTGKKVVDKIPKEKFRKIVLVAVLLAGIKLAADFLMV